MNFVHVTPRPSSLCGALQETQVLTVKTVTARPWRQILGAYQQPNHTRSLLEILVTAGPLLAIWAAGWLAVSAGFWWLGLALSVPAAAFLVRLFMIQHDCSHRSFFESRAANDWTGRIIGILTLTPHDCWRQSHAVHHATSGNLDRRGLGAILTLTAEEYSALSPLGRLGYRLFRHPLVLFGIGPAYMFIIEQRIPTGMTRDGWRPWLSAMATNAGIALFVAVVLWFGGWQTLVFVHLPTVLMGAGIGVWLFYVQHQFEGATWARNEEWDLTEAALLGSSHYDLPPVLAWFTANIGVHHVHHVASRIPSYRLQAVLRDHPELRNVSRLGLIASLRCIGLSLWDEAGQKLISFRQHRRMQRAAAAV